MNADPTLAPLLERFFTQRLMTQRQVSAHTIASYRDTFRLLLAFAQQQRRRPPSRLLLSELDAPLIDGFLNEVEKGRHCTPRSRNLRLTALRSFFRFCAFEVPTHAGQIQRVLAIPAKREAHPLIGFLTRPEIEALLAAPDRQSWGGRRDYAFLYLALQTGLRLSELTSLTRADLKLEPGAHVRVHGKGRKERCTPLTRQTMAVLKAWLNEPPRGAADMLFPTMHGDRLSSDAAQDLLAKHLAVARTRCPSLVAKRVTIHVLRHSAAMELLKSGVDTTIIALWLGHESIKTTQIYLDADLALKEAALAKTTPITAKPKRYKPGDELLAFLNNL
jgi:site-specific recombinase XerD